MNLATRTRWCADLRSGRFPQTRNRLRRGDKYCCLGVLAVGDGVPCKLHSENETYYDFFFPRGLILFSVLPLEYHGVPDAQYSELTKMNDSGTPFSEIADWIEAHIEVDDE